MTDRKQEKALIDALWARDEAAIGELEKKYGRLLFRVAEAVLSDTEDAEECVNDCLLAAWNQIPPKRPSHLSAYLCRIARNLALNRLAHSRAVRRNSAGNLSLEAMEELGWGLGELDAALETVNEDGLRTVLHDFLAELPCEMRIVFLRRYWFLESIDSIAAGSGFSESKVKSILFRCRNRLRAALEKEGVTV